MDFFKTDICKRKLLCLSPTETLRRFVEGSIEVYISKSSNRMHITAKRDLYDQSSVIDSVIRQHAFSELWFSGRRNAFNIKKVKLQL